MKPIIETLWSLKKISRSPFIHFPPSISQPQKGQLKNDPRPKLTHVRHIHWWVPRSAPPPSPWRSQKSKINWTHESWVEEWPPQVDAQNFRIIHHFIPSQPNTRFLPKIIYQIFRSLINFLLFATAKHKTAFQQCNFEWLMVQCLQQVMFNCKLSELTKLSAFVSFWFPNCAQDQVIYNPNEPQTVSKP